MLGALGSSLHNSVLFSKHKREQLRYAPHYNLCTIRHPFVANCEEVLNNAPTNNYCLPRSAPTAPYMMVPRKEEVPSNLFCYRNACASAVWCTNWYGIFIRRAPHGHKRHPIHNNSSFEKSSLVYWCTSALPLLSRIVEFLVSWTHPMYAVFYYKGLSSIQQLEGSVCRWTTRFTVWPWRT